MILPPNENLPSIKKGDPWVKCLAPGGGGKLSLFCFPYAGAGASIYGTWRKFFPDTVEIKQIQLPGREDRFSEEPFTSIDVLVDILCEEVFSGVHRPFALFGYSMGALIAYEVAKSLQKNHLNLPTHLFVAARQAPHARKNLPLLHRMPDNEFMEALSVRYRKIPEEIINQPEFLAYTLRTLRADFTLLETYRCTGKSLLNCPITSFGGTSDRMVSESDLSEWKDYTAKSFTRHLLSGNHFFLENNRQHLITLIVNALRMDFQSQSL